MATHAARLARVEDQTLANKLISRNSKQTWSTI